MASESIASGVVLITTPSVSSNSADDLACLGGLPEGGHAVNRIERTSASEEDGASVYAALPRPARLPPPNFKLRKHNQEARAAYLKIWDGNFQMRWVLQDANTLFLEGSIVAERGGAADRFVGVIFTALLHTTAGMLSMNMGYPNKEFAATFKEGTRDILPRRALYHFLRTHGTCLMNHCPSLVGFSMISAAGKSLENLYQGDAKTMLDLKILRCDLAKNHNHHPMEIGILQSEVGEALEAMGEFKKAALLYRHAAEAYATPLQSMDNHASLLENSALAYKRDNQLDTAEEIYIRALHFRRRCTCNGNAGAWDLNEEFTHTLLHNMVMLYYALHNVKGRRSGTEILPVFFALLYTAGYQPEGGAGYLAHHLIDKYGQSNASLLHQDIQNNPGRALAALVTATGRPDKAHFYSALAGCVPPGTTFVHLDECLQRPDAAEDRAISVELARGVVAEAAAETVSIKRNTCAYKRCPHVGSNWTLKTCPCKAVSYCQKSCQAADWPEHKKLCSWQAKRKKERNATS